MSKTFHSIYTSAREINLHRPLNNKHEVLVTDQEDFEGRPVQVSKYVVDDPSHRYDGLKASDFALENQIAVGIEFKEVRCQYNNFEIDSMIDNANKNNNE